MKKELLDDIDAIIKCFEIAPGAFDNNVWRCYSDCKKVVYKAKEDGVIPWDSKLYGEYLGYITEKLKI